MKLSFDNWMMCVDTHLARITGFVSGDLLDWCYWDNWNDGEEPYNTALEVAEYNGYTI